jgi:hypothetical protein
VHVAKGAAAAAAAAAALKAHVSAPMRTRKSG